MKYNFNLTGGEIQIINQNSCNRINKFDIILFKNNPNVIYSEISTYPLRQNTNIKYYKKITIDEIEFNAGKIPIGIGSYGAVYAYLNNDNLGFVVKYGNVIDDMKVLDEIVKIKNCVGNYVKSHIEFKKNHNDVGNFIIMEYMDGDLTNYIRANKPLSFDNVYNIFKELLKHIKCFAYNRLYFTDLKTDNILYKCNHQNNIIEISLGDLGGFAIINKYGHQIKKGIFTLPPPSKKIDYYNPNIITEKDIVWSFGIVILELLSENTREYYWDFMERKNDSVIQTIISANLTNIKNKEPQNNDIKYFVDQILSKILAVDEKDRLSFDDISKIITEYETIKHSGKPQEILHNLERELEQLIKIKQLIEEKKNELKQMSQEGKEDNLNGLLSIQKEMIEIKQKLEGKMQNGSGKIYKQKFLKYKNKYI